MIDLERALELLTLVEKLATQPKYTNIRAQALAELDELNNPQPAMTEPEEEKETTNRRRA